MLSPSLDTIRLFLHVLSASVWVGGQFVMAGLLPTARSLSEETPKALAGAFGRVAWPAYAIAVITGMWGIFANQGSGLDYDLTLGVKILLVAAAGASAAVHSQTKVKRIKAITGAVGGLLSLLILFLGVLLTSAS